VEIPLVRTPVKSGRNIPTLSEVAARNQLLRVMGYHSAEGFNRELLKQLLEAPALSKPFEPNEE
jgi:HPr kinase/phosphorylase